MQGSYARKVGYGGAGEFFFFYICQLKICCVVAET